MTTSNIIIGSLGLGLVASLLYLFGSNKENLEVAVGSNVENDGFIPTQDQYIQGNKLKILSGSTILAMSPRCQVYLRQIEETIGMTPAAFKTDVMPFLIQFARYVQLTPASASYHHSAPGGLLEHTLEVATIALRQAKNAEIPLNTDTEDRKRLLPAWMYGILVAAVLHDIGKLETNLVIRLFETSSSKDYIQWHPGTGPMDITTKFQWYSVDFPESYPDNHNEHSRLSWGLFSQVVPERTRAWMSAADPRLIETLRLYLTTAKSKKKVDGKSVDVVEIPPFSTIVGAADSESTKNDLANGSKERFSTAPTPLRERIVQYLREMASSGMFMVGRDSNGQLFRVGEKIFIASKHMADEVRKYATNKGDTAFPQNDTYANTRIFEELYNCNAIEPNSFETEKYVWYAKIKMSNGSSHLFTFICFKANTLFGHQMSDWPNEYSGDFEILSPNEALASGRNVVESNNEIETSNDSMGQPTGSGGEGLSVTDNLQQISAKLAQLNNKDVPVTTDSAQVVDDNNESGEQVDDNLLLDLTLQMSNLTSKTSTDSEIPVASSNLNNTDTIGASKSETEIVESTENLETNLTHPVGFEDTTAPSGDLKLQAISEKLKSVPKSESFSALPVLENNQDAARKFASGKAKKNEQARHNSKRPNVSAKNLQPTQLDPVPVLPSHEVPVPTVDVAPVFEPQTETQPEQQPKIHAVESVESDHSDVLDVEHRSGERVFEPVDNITPVDVKHKPTVGGIKTAGEIAQMQINQADDVLVDAVDSVSTLKESELSRRELGLQFIVWLQNGLQSGEIHINVSDAAVHVVKQGVLLLSPKIFKLFTEIHTRVGDDNETTRLVQQAFEKMELHKVSRITKSSLYRARVIPVGQTKSSTYLNVYLIEAGNTKSLFSSLPPINANVVLEDETSVAQAFNRFTATSKNQGKIKNG